MLTIEVEPVELWDEVNEEFIVCNGGTLRLEHSLVAISKWESKWHKPFLHNKEEKTPEQVLDYIRCMCINENEVDPALFKCLSKQNIDDITEYIDNPMTATWFGEEKDKKPTSRKIITSELIYYWMVASTIPFEAQYWHINRLLTLIRVCGEENKPQKKQNKHAAAASRAELNAARRKAMHTNG